jgi:hypothetical protein
LLSDHKPTFPAHIVVRPRLHDEAVREVQRGPESYSSSATMIATASRMCAH